MSWDSVRGDSVQGDCVLDSFTYCITRLVYTLLENLLESKPIDIYSQTRRVTIVYRPTLCSIIYICIKSV